MQIRKLNFQEEGIWHIKSARVYVHMGEKRVPSKSLSLKFTMALMSTAFIVSQVVRHKNFTRNLGREGTGLWVLAREMQKDAQKGKNLP